jgi:RNA polymerase sigma-70 factor (ECF subfamily)
MTESDAILGAQEGSRDAFRWLYESYREKIFSLAYHYTRSTEDAEDVLQETFIRAFKGLKTFESGPESRFGAWISTIGLRCVFMHLRRTKRRKSSDHVSLTDLVREPAAEDPEPDRAVAAARTLKWIQAAQRDLPPRQQVAFDLRYRQHLAIKEIAARMNCGESNIKTQLSRAVEKLRKQLDPLWGKP